MGCSKWLFLIQTFSSTPISNKLLYLLLTLFITFDEFVVDRIINNLQSINTVFIINDRVDIIQFSAMV